MTKQLTTQNATITTAAVEVKTLTISGKQVTLAVFRQLREEPLLAEDCTPNGAPWGVVNYHPDKCSDHEEHLHVVWQRGEELLRSAIYAPHVARHHSAVASAFVETSIVAGRRKWDGSPSLVDDLFIGRPSHSGAPAHIRFRYDGVRFFGEISPEAWGASSGHTGALDDLKTRIGNVDQAVLLASLPCDAYREAWRGIHTLPQLFIAV